jgi:hypothetical protein
MPLRFLVRAGAIVLVGAALVGCSDNAKKQLGLGKNSPDEFKVVSRAPLTLPPNFALRPPAPGQVRPQEGSATQQARQAVFRAEPKQAASAGVVLAEPVENQNLTSGEQALLKSAGAGNADPDIRRVVDSETARINSESETFIDSLIFWREDPPPGEIIDANAESRRLREASAVGSPITGEGAPSIERRRKGALEGIF